MLDLESNRIDYRPDLRLDIDMKLRCDGFVHIQFTVDDLPDGGRSIAAIERFFVDFIEQLGGQCVKHNDESDSLVWHVRPIEQTDENTSRSLARSHTDNEFALHTDCSYETHPPEYVALFVLESDECGGGQLELVRWADLLPNLSTKSRAVLLHDKFRIDTPPEFRHVSAADHIDATILIDEQRIRYRSDIVVVSNGQCSELDELKSLIEQAERRRPRLDRYSMIILNNHTYLHGRTKVADKRRHLLRVRFNRPLPYHVFSVYDRTKFSERDLTFTNEFNEYLHEQHERLHRILTSIVEQYDQPTSIGDEIRRTFQFDCRIDRLITQLNQHRTPFTIGTYRADLLFGQGDAFRVNGQQSFAPKLCEINTRFAFNGYFLTAGVHSNDDENQLASALSNAIETIIDSARFDRGKAMFIVKGKEHGHDIHLFRQYWTTSYSQTCSFVRPDRLTIERGRLVDGESLAPIEQFVLELHQEEILALSDELLQFISVTTHLNYINDLRTIFLLHDKRLFSLLSNERFVYALLDRSDTSFTSLIPTTLVIDSMPKYVEHAIVHRRQDWCIKPNAAGKGVDVTIGMRRASSPLDEHTDWTCGG
jgi:hypothetical protein